MTDEKYLKALGERIVDLRKAKGMTQTDLAEKIGVKFPMVGRIERGAVNPTINTLRKFANALGVSVSELINI
ncbi:MAG: helix-turn-helix domain-containing protein [Bacteroidota bacterium]